MSNRILSFLLALLPCLVFVECSFAQRAPELTNDNVQAWKEHISPKDQDLVWQQIPWLTTFADGVLAANEQDKPLLLWAMNGHPLGCT